MLKYLLLAFLSERDQHGYDLKAAIDEHFHGTWNVNAGQIYSTLDRLERDGLVTRSTVHQDQGPDRRMCSITADGRLELKRWLLEPVDGPVQLRDELFTKALVHHLAGDRTLDAIWQQRDTHLKTMAGLRRIRGEGLDPTTQLLVDGVLLRLEADLKWLDLWERMEGEGG